MVEFGNKVYMLSYMSWYMVYYFSFCKVSTSWNQSGFQPFRTQRVPQCVKYFSKLQASEMSHIISFFTLARNSIYHDGSWFLSCFIDYQMYKMWYCLCITCFLWWMYQDFFYGTTVALLRCNCTALWDATPWFDLDNAVQWFICWVQN